MLLWFKFFNLKSKWTKTVKNTFFQFYMCVHWRVKLGQIHILNVSIDGNLQDEEIIPMAYF